MPSRLTDAGRARISATHKGKVVSKETRQKLSAARKGRRMSEEVKELISQTLKGRKFSEEHRRGISEAKTGKGRPPLSTEWKARIAQGTKRRMDSMTPEEKDAWILSIKQGRRKRSRDSFFDLPATGEASE